MFRYLINILIGLDQLATTLVGGYPDETLSSYAHRLHTQKKFFGFFKPIINFIFFWQDDHCKMAYQEEVERYQFPTALR